MLGDKAITIPSGGPADDLDLTEPNGSAFVTEATAAFGIVRQALSDLIQGLPGEKTRATDLQKALGVDYKLAWQIFNISRSTQPLANANHVPGPPSLKRLLAAADAAGITRGTLNSVRSAVQHFEDMIQRHAGNRAAFDSMITAASDGDATEAVDLLHRRNTFRGNSHIWGIQVETYYNAVMIRPSPTGRGTDECVVNLKLGLQRLRPDAMLVVHGYRHHSSVNDGPERFPLSPASLSTFGAPLVPEFCSTPLPRFKTTRHEDGWTTSEIIGDGVGLRSAVDLCFAGIGRGVPFSFDVDGRPLFRSAVTFGTPAALLVSDLLIHRPSFGAVVPEARSHRSTPGDESPVIANRAQQLPLRSRISSLGRGIQNAESSDIPRVREMLQYAANAVGWDLDEFDLFRLRVPYPVLHSVVKLQFCAETHSRKA